MRAFTIDGIEYPIPMLATFNMREAVVFYDNNRFPVEDLWSPPDTEEEATERLEQFRNPRVTLSMLHVAYLRGNPDAPRKQIERVVEEVKLVSALAAFIPDDEEEVPEVPLERTSEPSESSIGSSLDAPTLSGSSSEKSSAELVTDQSLTGTFG